MKKTKNTQTAQEPGRAMSSEEIEKYCMKLHMASMERGPVISITFSNVMDKHAKKIKGLKYLTTEFNMAGRYIYVVNDRGMMIPIAHVSSDGSYSVQIDGDSIPVVYDHIEVKARKGVVKKP